MNRLPLMYAKSYRCECGKSYEIRSDKYSLLFEVECAIAQANMMNHRILWCSMNTFKLKEKQHG